MASESSPWTIIGPQQDSCLPIDENTGSRLPGQRSTLRQWRRRTIRPWRIGWIGSSPAWQSVSCPADTRWRWMLAIWTPSLRSSSRMSTPAWTGRGRDALKRWYDGVLRRFYRSIHLICGHAVRLRQPRSRDRVDILPGRARGRRRVVRHHDALRRCLRTSRWPMVFREAARASLVFRRRDRATRAGVHALADRRSATGSHAAADADVAGFLDDGDPSLPGRLSRASVMCNSQISENDHYRWLGGTSFPTARCSAGFCARGRRMDVRAPRPELSSRNGEPRSSRSSRATAVIRSAASSPWASWTRAADRSTT